MTLKGGSSRGSSWAWERKAGRVWFSVRGNGDAISVPVGVELGTRLVLWWEQPGVYLCRVHCLTALGASKRLRTGAGFIRLARSPSPVA